MRSLLLVLAVLPALHATADAGSLLHVAFDEKTTECKRTIQSIAADKWLVEIEVESAGKPTPAAKAIPVRFLGPADGKELGKTTIAAKQASVMSSLPATAAMIVEIGGTGTRCNFVAAAAVAPQVTDKAELDKQQQEKTARDQSAKATAERSTQVVAAARRYLAERHITDHGKAGGRLGRTYRLYHLPDGSPAFPLPNTIAEEDRIELWIATEVGKVPTAEVTACKEAPIARISGTRPGATASGETLESTARNLQDDPPEIQLVRAAPSVKCSEQLAYKINGGAGEREVTLKIAPVFLFSWGLAFGFDFGRPTRLKVVDVPVDGGTERSIVKESDRTGLRPMITLTLNACRANLADWDLCDAVGLTAMADLGRLTEGGGLGVKLQPYPGLGILVGVTLYQVDTLEVGRERDVQNLAIDKEFRWQSFGLFLGVGGDTETVKALF